MSFDLLHIGITHAIVIVASILGSAFVSELPPESNLKVNDSVLISLHNLSKDEIDPEIGKGGSKDKEKPELKEEKEKKTKIVLGEATSSAVTVSQKVIASEARVIEKREIVAEERVEVNTQPVPSIPEIALNSDGAEKLFAMTNEHRAKLGLPVLEKDERLCSAANQRATQIYDEIFVSGPMHKGFFALNLPYWASENIASYQSIEENFNFLVNDPPHRKAIESDNKYSCVACSGNSCSQIFSSFVTK